MPTVMPPAGDGPVSTVDAEMLKMPRPLHERNPRIPAALSELVLDCVRPAPEERIGMMQVIDRLETLGRELAEAKPIMLWNGDRAGVTGSAPRCPSRCADSRRSQSIMRDGPDAGGRTCSRCLLRLPYHHSPG